VSILFSAFARFFNEGWNIDIISMLTKYLHELITVVIMTIDIGAKI